MSMKTEPLEIFLLYGKYLSTHVHTHLQHNIIMPLHIMQSHTCTCTDTYTHMVHTQRMSIHLTGVHMPRLEN